MSINELLCRIVAWFAEMNPMPPMSAASAYTWSMPFVASRQFSQRTEVQLEELVGARVGELGTLDVDAAYPVPLILEVVDEVVADETAGAGNECSSLRSHGHPCRLRVNRLFSNPCE